MIAASRALRRFDFKSKREARADRIRLTGSPAYFL
jgi:hypothetical protein